jgi:hypothetical protein
MGQQGFALIETVDGAVARLEVRRGSWLVGRGTDAHLRLYSDRVSTRHAWIRRDGRGVWVSDAGSRAGTQVNGRRLGPNEDCLLYNGDRLDFGPIGAVFSDSGSVSADTAPAARAWRRSSGASLGDTPVETAGATGRDTAGRNAAGRDTAGRGAGNAVLFLGMVMLLTGFGVWVSVLFTYLKYSANGAAGAVRPSLLGPDAVGGVPWGVAGFVLFGAGIVVTVLGLVMAEAARERQRRIRSTRDGRAI